MEKKEDEANKTTEGNKRKLIKEELGNVKRKKLEVESLITSMRANIEKLTQRNNLKEIKMLLQKTDTFRKTVQQKVDGVNIFDSSITYLRKDLLKYKILTQNHFSTPYTLIIIRSH